MTMQSGTDIVHGLKMDDTRALRMIHDLYYSSLKNFASGLVGDIPPAEDIVTDVFVVLWRKRQDFETQANIKAFLFISTRNACFNYVKKMRRDTRMKLGLSKYLSDDHEEFVLNKMIRKEVLMGIYAAIESLPLQCRRVFKCCYVDGKKNADVAEQFNISVNTVKNHKARGLELLREKILPSKTLLVLMACLQIFMI